MPPVETPADSITKSFLGAFVRTSRLAWFDFPSSNGAYVKIYNLLKEKLTHEGCWIQKSISGETIFHDLGPSPISLYKFP